MGFFLGISWSLHSPSNLMMLADDYSFVFGVAVLLWCFDVYIVVGGFLFLVCRQKASAGSSMLSPLFFSYSSSSSEVDSFVKNVGSALILTSCSKAAGV